VSAEVSAGQVKAALATYFAVVGVLSPYLGLYMDAIGLNASQIALLLALPQITRVFAPPFWGWLADRYARPDLILKFSALAMMLSAIGLLFSGGSVAAISIALLSFYLFSAAQMPLVEAYAIGVSQGHAGAYGDMRVWGSLGFVLAVVACGPFLDWAGRTTLPWIVAAISAVLFVSCLGYKPALLKSPLRIASPIADVLKNRQVSMLLASCTLHVFAHSALYGFLSLYLAKQGFTGAAIGGLWAVGVITEIAWFKFQQRFFNHYSSHSVLVFCTAIAVARFALLGALDGSGTVWWAILSITLLQASHAFTFAAHHTAIMNKMHEWFSQNQQSRAQAFFVASVYGVGGATGTFAAGWCWVNIGPAWAFYGAAFASALALFLAYFAPTSELSQCMDKGEGEGERKGKRA
jgi:MFS transporter, PPP family, 3-phenylpropionic acid transporter